jgi:threonine/homoserine/homoserine lactone efflux protein
MSLQALLPELLQVLRAQVGFPIAWVASHAEYFSQAARLARLQKSRPRMTRILTMMPGMMMTAMAAAASSAIGSRRRKSHSFSVDA